MKNCWNQGADRYLSKPLKVLVSTGGKAVAPGIEIVDIGIRPPGDVADVQFRMEGRRQKYIGHLLMCSILEASSEVNIVSSYYKFQAHHS